MEVLELDGKRYMKASTAARTHGYTADYIGQLCRARKISAHLVGRSWYVDADELRNHKVASKRSSRLKARQQIKKALAERKKGEKENEMHFEKHLPERHIAYEEDAAELMPEVKKLPVQIQRGTKKKKSGKEPQTLGGKPYEIEAKGKKILMSGTLDIVDATDEFMLDEDAVKLEPKILKTPKKKEKGTKSRNITNVDSSSEVSLKISYDQPKDKNSSFLRRLESMEEEALLSAGQRDIERTTRKTNEIPIENLDITGSTGANERESYNHSISEPKGSSIPTRSISLALSLAIVFACIFLESRWVYTAGTGESGEEKSILESTYSIDSERLFARIPFKI